MKKRQKERRNGQRECINRRARAVKLKEKDFTLKERKQTLWELERALRKRTREVLDQESEKNEHIQSKQLKQNKSANKIVNLLNVEINIKHFENTQLFFGNIKTLLKHFEFFIH